MLPLLAPMLAVIGPPPAPTIEAEYAYETLWNGARVIAHLPGDGGLRLLSQAGLDVTAQYPELQTLALLLPGGQAVLDGELVTLDEDGRPSVERLQQRMSPVLGLALTVVRGVSLIITPIFTTPASSVCAFDPDDGRLASSW